MNASLTEVVNAAGNEIVLRRVIHAPRERVWIAWTDPEQVAEWWGPDGFTTTTDEMDVRPGGVWRFVMHGPDGVDYKNLIHYVEVVKPRYMTYQHGGEEEHASIRFHVTVTFEEHDGKTTVTLHSVFPTPEERDRVIREHGALEGGKQTLARLDEYLRNQA